MASRMLQFSGVLSAALDNAGRSIHVSVGRKYRCISLCLRHSSRETSVSRLYSTREKKNRSTIGGHWRARVKKTATISVRKKGRTDAKLYFSFAPSELSSPQLQVVRLSRTCSSNLRLMAASPGDDENVLLRKKNVMALYVYLYVYEIHIDDIF